jgi:hypothetical protein
MKTPPTPDFCQNSLNGARTLSITTFNIINTQPKGPECDTQYKRHSALQRSAITLSVTFYFIIMLNVIMLKSLCLVSFC